MVKPTQWMDKTLCERGRDAVMPRVRKKRACHNAKRQPKA
jgi:hypothetical protein